LNNLIRSGSQDFDGVEMKSIIESATESGVGRGREGRGEEGGGRGRKSRRQGV